MLMRIDNEPCQAAIYQLTVGGVPAASNCCGFVSYQPGSDIGMSFWAYHPNNFADFSFVVQKGTCNDTAQSTATNTSGMVIGSTANYARDMASVYSKSFTPAMLLGMCANEGKAAFAQSLYVASLATNGNYIAGQDASALAAFALEPDMP
jgi:hypothetical protein